MTVEIPTQFAKHIDLRREPWTIPENRIYFIKIDDEQMNNLTCHLHWHRHYMIGKHNICSNILKDLVLLNRVFATRLYYELLQDIENELDEIDIQVKKDLKERELKQTKSPLTLPDRKSLELWGEENKKRRGDYCPDYIKYKKERDAIWFLNHPFI